MKSQVDIMLHVLFGICEDLRRAYPAYKGVDLDKERIALTCRTRGLSFFTLDLPNLNDLLLQGLETGRLSLSGPLCHKVSKRIQVPRLFSGLWLRVFDKNASLKLDADPSAIAFLRQLSSLGKKLEVGCSASRREATLMEYHNVEESLRSPSIRWDQDRLDVRELRSYHLDNCVSPLGLHDLFGQFETDRRQHNSRNEHLLRRCQQVADIIAECLPIFSPIEYSTQLESEGRGIGFKHGPGAVAEQQKNWEKSQFNYWPAKLEGWFPFIKCAFMPNDDRSHPINHEVASRLHCVPKTAKGPRLIAAEPVAHQWCQQIMWSWLEDSVMNLFRGKFINFRKQEASAKLVLRASKSRKLATVDLSSASDRLTCWTVERMFRRNPSILIALHAARTRYLRDDISSNGSSFIKLKKFASQGTATTFPVQSIVFLIIALASCFDEKEPTFERIWKLRNQVRVYGDDIIIPRHGYGRLCVLMDLLQLKVNIAKSYVNGHFRESCGTDGYMGYDVTPVKPKVIVADGPEAVQSVLDTVNNLFKKGYWLASDHLLQTIPPRVLRSIRITRSTSSGFTGLSSFSAGYESHLRRRWNPYLQRFEGQVLALRSNTSTSTREGYAPILDFLSKPWSRVNPRITSVYGRTRGTKLRLTWEPLDMEVGCNLPLANGVNHGSRWVHFPRPSPRTIAMRNYS